MLMNPTGNNVDHLVFLVSRASIATAAMTAGEKLPSATNHLVSEIVTHENIMQVQDPFLE